ncbi:MAG: alpha/beta hydrolase [Anaerolineae bacterium]|nr:alpha/beta hydrolase [Anaerolineae bacterium]
MNNNKTTLPELAGVKHRFVTLGDVRFHIAEAGVGAPLVLLHGWPQHWFLWRHQIPILAESYRVICPDLRGFGWSDAPPAGYDKEQLAADIFGVLDALEIGSFRLMGHDWGGWVGFLMCLNQPERIKRFLALNIAHPFQSVDARLFSAWRFWYQYIIATPGLGYSLIRSAWFVEKLITLGFSQQVLSQKELEIYSRVLREPQRAKASVLLYRTFLLREFFPIALGKYKQQRLEMPVRILFGRNDFALSVDLLRDFQAYGDDLAIEFVDDCGHFIVEEKPELVTGRALTFFVR